MQTLPRRKNGQRPHRRARTEVPYLCSRTVVQHVVRPCKVGLHRAESASNTYDRMGCLVSVNRGMSSRQFQDMAREVRQRGKSEESIRKQLAVLAQSTRPARLLRNPGNPWRPLETPGGSARGMEEQAPSWDLEAPKRPLERPANQERTGRPTALEEWRKPAQAHSKSL